MRQGSPVKELMPIFRREDKMKKITLITLVAVMLLTLSLVSAWAQDKFAYVDLSRIFNEYEKTKVYDKSLSDVQNAYDTEREKKVNEIKQLQEKLNLMADKEKENKKTDIDSKVKLLQDFDRQKQMDLRKDQDEKMKEILKDIEETVKQYAEKEGYTFVFNDRVLVYENKSLDITNIIIENLNKTYKK
jgi:outer membrane protein